MTKEGEKGRAPQKNGGGMTREEVGNGKYMGGRAKEKGRGEEGEEWSKEIGVSHDVYFPVNCCIGEVTWSRDVDSSR